MITRRGLITGLVSLMAAPAIVRAASIMPVKAVIHEWVPSMAFEAVKDGEKMLIHLQWKIIELTDDDRLEMQSAIFQGAREALAP